MAWCGAISSLTSDSCEGVPVNENDWPWPTMSRSISSPSRGPCSLLPWAPFAFGSHRESAPLATWNYRSTQDLCELSKKLTCAHCVCPNFSFYKLTAATQGKVMECLVWSHICCIKCLQDQGTKACSLTGIKRVCLEESEFENFVKYSYSSRKSVRLMELLSQALPVGLVLEDCWH